MTFYCSFRMADYFMHIYEAPWCRIGPYLMGVLFGYAMSREWAKTQEKTLLSWKVLFSGWFFTVAIAGTVLYSIYKAHLTNLEASLYTSLSRPAWALALIWILYVCITDQCRPVNAILSYPAFVPLSRATYVAYLIHPLVISTFYSSLRETTHFSHLNMFVYFSGITLWTYIMAICISIVAEAPFIALEKWIVSQLTGARRGGHQMIGSRHHEEDGGAESSPEDKKMGLDQDEYVTPGTSAGVSGGGSSSSLNTDHVHGGGDHVAVYPREALQDIKIEGENHAEDEKTKNSDDD